MPRCKTNRHEFVAGALPTITIKGTSYYVDGRLEELRNTSNFMDVIDCVDDDVFDLLSNDDKSIVMYEFTGEEIIYN